VLETVSFYRADLPEQYPTSIDSVFTEISEQSVGPKFGGQNIFFLGILDREYGIDTPSQNSGKG
jgi:hypothetical protein